MANPHKGEVEVDFHKSIAKGYLTTHGAPVTLKFDFNAMADAELEFRSSESLFEVLSKSAEDPTKVSLHDMRVLLAAGLKHQFRQQMTVELAGNILNTEDFAYVTAKIGEALNLGFQGSLIPEKARPVLGAEQFVAEDDEKKA